MAGQRIRKSFTIHSRHTDTVKEYFFSTDHCQGVNGRSEGTYPEGFVPGSFHLPMTVVPRPSLPSGNVETLEDFLMIFFDDYTEIPNPDPRYQP